VWCRSREGNHSDECREGHLCEHICLLRRE
jgi:hypothetical protein